MLIAQDLELTFGQQEVFKQVSFTIQLGQKVGLVGRNGAGKSTLLKVIGGRQPLDKGAISLERERKIAYLPQEVVLLSSRSILDETCSVFDEAQALQKKVTELEAILATGEATDEQFEEYTTAITALSDFDLPALVVEAKQVLQGLGLGPDRWDTPVDQLSVGWKMRVVLAKLLLQKADLYLFDEPTNHLDIVAQTWFLDFLKNARFGFLLVSHDRYFLDHVCNYIFEVEMGRGTMYTGNYTRYLEQKAQAEELLQKQYDAQQREIKKKMEVINKFRASASRASTAQSMLKALDKMEKVEIHAGPATMRISVPPAKRSGDIVMSVEGISKSFDAKQLFKDVAFNIKRGEKVALVAANGVGKTTLLSILMGKLEQDAGKYTLGYNVEPVLFEQDQERSLDGEKTVLAEAELSAKTQTAHARLRPLLGSFLFSGDDVSKRVRVLSGGEKNRLAMVKVLLAEGNFLLLDEPTNHLDLQSKEILGQALKQFEGTILFVSHDRTFLDELATRILELTPTGIRSYEGNFESYQYAKHVAERALLEKQAAAGHLKGPQKKIVTPDAGTAKGAARSEDQQKKIKNLESSIAKLEKENETITHKFADVSWGTDEYKKLEVKHAHLKKQLEEAYELWEKLTA